MAGWRRGLDGTNEWGARGLKRGFNVGPTSTRVYIAIPPSPFQLIPSSRSRIETPRGGPSPCAEYNCTGTRKVETLSVRFFAFLFSRKIFLSSPDYSAVFFLLSGFVLCVVYMCGLDKKHCGFDDRIVEMSVFLRDVIDCFVIRIFVFCSSCYIVYLFCG